jgi:hypothetical protein
LQYKEIKKTTAQHAIVKDDSALPNSWYVLKYSTTYKLWGSLVRVAWQSKYAGAMVLLQWLTLFIKEFDMMHTYLQHASETFIEHAFKSKSLAYGCISPE